MTSPIYNGSSYRITIPMEIMKAKDWNTETELEVKIENEKLVIQEA